MATQNFSNRIASQSLRGTAVIVTCDGTDAANIYKLAKGQLATNQSSNKTGTVGFIDVYGHVFEVLPIQPDKDFASAGVYGYLANAEVVIVTL